jgi:hypothetical protein
MPINPNYIDYYNSLDESDASKSRQFIRQVLRGDIVNEQAKYTCNQFDPLYNTINYASYSINPSITVEADIKVRYDDIVKCAYQLDRLILDSDKLNFAIENSQKNSESLNNLLESNASCKQAWDKFLMLARLSGGDAELIEKLQNRKLL